MTAHRRIAAVEPYFGGSHRHFLLDLQRHSRHDLQLFTLSPRLWKWRVRGAALNLARQLNAAAASLASERTLESAPGRAAPAFDVLLCSDFVNLPDLRALLRPELRRVPVLYYMHENQLSYPLSPAEEFDPYFGFTNVLSCLSAEAVAFNSDFHRRDFLAHLPDILPRLPDYEPRWVIEAITAKAEVLPIGIDVVELEERRPLARPADGPRRILWNHRWEFDKRPEIFFSALENLIAEDVPFGVDIVGETFARRPAVFDSARELLGERLGRFGWVESRPEYIDLLWQSDVVVSTANQEFFGISMAEATLCGAHPIAPQGLVYEDLYGGECGRRHLVRSAADLPALLRRAIETPEHDCAIRQRLRAFDWAAVAPRFDARFEALSEADRSTP